MHVQPELVATAQVTCNDMSFDLMVYNVKLVQYDQADQADQSDPTSTASSSAELYGIKVSDVMRLVGHADKLVVKSGKSSKPSFVLDSTTASNWSLAAWLVGRPIPTAATGSVQLAGTTGKSAKSAKLIQLANHKLPVGPNDIVLADDIVSKPCMDVALQGKFRVNTHSQSFCQVFENQVRSRLDCILRDYTLAELCAQQIHVRPETARFLVNQANRASRASRASRQQSQRVSQTDQTDCAGWNQIGRTGHVFADLQECEAYSSSHGIGELANIVIRQFDTRLEGSKLSHFVESRIVRTTDKRYRFKSRCRLGKTSQLVDDHNGGHGEQTSFDRTSKQVGSKREAQHSHKYNRSLHHSRWDKHQAARQSAASMIDQDEFVQPRPSTRSTKTTKTTKSTKSTKNKPAVNIDTSDQTNETSLKPTADNTLRSVVGTLIIHS